MKAIEILNFHLTLTSILQNKKQSTCKHIMCNVHRFIASRMVLHAHKSFVLILIFFKESFNAKNCHVKEIKKD